LEWLDEERGSHWGLGCLSGETGYKNDWNTSQKFVGREICRHLIPILPRHPNIQEDSIRLESGRDVHGLGWVVLFGGNVAMPPQQFPKNMGCVRLVIYD